MWGGKMLPTSASKPRATNVRRNSLYAAIDLSMGLLTLSRVSTCVASQSSDFDRDFPPWLSWHTQGSRSEGSDATIVVIISHSTPACVSESCPIQDDPERGECFQHKMILKTTKVGGGTLRVNANHHAEGRKSQRRAGFRPGPPNRIYSGRAHSAETALPRIDQKRQRRRAPLIWPS